MIKVKICTGSRCMMAGASTISDVLEDLIEDIAKQHPEIEIVIDNTKCRKYCVEDKTLVPVVQINEDVIFNASTQVVMEKVMDLVKMELELT